MRNLARKSTFGVLAALGLLVLFSSPAFADGTMTVDPASAEVGTEFTVPGDGCVATQLFTEPMVFYYVEVNGNLIIESEVTPAPDGTWAFNVTPAQTGTGVVDARCVDVGGDFPEDIFAYADVTFNVTAVQPTTTTTTEAPTTTTTPPTTAAPTTQAPEPTVTVAPPSNQGGQQITVPPARRVSTDGGLAPENDAGIPGFVYVMAFAGFALVGEIIYARRRRATMIDG